MEPTKEEQLQQELHVLQHEFDAFKQSVVAELQQRNNREHEMLQRLYVYMANEINIRRQQGQEE